MLFQSLNNKIERGFKFKHFITKFLKYFIFGHIQAIFILLYIYIYLLHEFPIVLLLSFQKGLIRN